MNKLIYLKYGELCLKGKNRETFSRIAWNNLQFALSDFDLSYHKHYDYIEIKNIVLNQLDSIVSITRKIPGFCSLAIAEVCDKDMQLIMRTALSFIEKDTTTFKIEAKRADKNYYLNSDQIKREVGNYILKNTSLKVDIFHPQIKIYIEIKSKEAFIYAQKIECANGLPVGSSGRALMLLSGGIDSPVAAHLLMKRGLKVDFLSFITPPHTDEKVVDKIQCLIRKITLDYRLQSTKLYLCNYTHIQHELSHLKNESYRITILRRSFMRIASHLKKRFNYDVIATGDSLGQVASQTIDSLNVVSQTTNDLIMRPLIAFDKNEIINIAKKIDTYETSILPFSDSCSLFAPKNPITKPNLQNCLDYEKQIDLLLDMEENIIDKIEIFKYLNQKTE